MNEPLWVRGIDHHCAIDSFVNQIDATPINRTGTGKRACLRDPLTKPLQFFRWTQLGPGHVGMDRAKNNRLRLRLEQRRFHCHLL